MTETNFSNPYTWTDTDGDEHTIATSGSDPGDVQRKQNELCEAALLLFPRAS